MFKKSGTPGEPAILYVPFDRLGILDYPTFSQFQRLGLSNILSCLFFFPRSYEDYTNICTINQLQVDELQTVVGTVQALKSMNLKKGKHIFSMTIVDNAGYVLEVSWFNQKYRASMYRSGQFVSVSGRPKCRLGKWSMLHPTVSILNSLEAASPTEILPTYSLTAGLTQWKLRKLLRRFVDEYSGLVEDIFPPQYLEEWNLLPIAEAIRQIHAPADKAAIDASRRRFVFQELFLLQLALGVKRRQNQCEFRAPEMKTDAAIDSHIRKLFPYELTDGQNKAIKEIVADMTSPHPMNRLLQGDVGCGKTTVAVYAILLTVASGFQAVLMAPTEILARQHFKTISKLLAESIIVPDLLVGGMQQRDKQELLGRISDGSAKIVIGTHALLQDGVDFRNLGLLIIDEQHKFGVNQRAKLRRGVTTPHYLVMTATPIPRTISMSLFGDLNLTTVKELPPGRQPVSTYLISEQKREEWYRFINQKLVEGRQAYVIVPQIRTKNETPADAVSPEDMPVRKEVFDDRITEEMVTGSFDSEDESEIYIDSQGSRVQNPDPDGSHEIANIMSMEQKLLNSSLGKWKIGIVHGRLTSEQKDEAMLDFVEKKTQILLCTSVVEVGVDVPNATIMTIESAQQFGLSQLHQLRGRIGRGKFPAFCSILADTDDPQALERLLVFTETTDGFKLAETDFQMRGPGNLFSNQQHGLPPFHIADLARDRAILEEARIIAEKVLNEDTGLSKNENAKLRHRLLMRYGATFGLADVG